MIRYTQGNLLAAEVDAVVNTVNEVGVMGKGIALQFRETFPASSKAYMQAGKRGEIQVGRMFVTAGEDLTGPRWIIHFPTKKHWRQPSRLEWVKTGLMDLVRVLREKQIRSVAVPPLGCGNGGLEWGSVKAEIERALGELRDVDVVVYEPTTAHRAARKQEGLHRLTPARALIVELVRRYGVLGFECSLVEVQKLAWLLKREIDRLGLEDPLQLEFTAHRYGPYSNRLDHLLDGLDGSFLHCDKRLGDAGPFEPMWFESSKRDELEAYLASENAARYSTALERTSDLIDGFQSPFGMELLATVDWLLAHGACEPTVRGLRAGLKAWPGGSAAAARKAKMFDERVLGLALERLAPGSAHEVGLRTR